MRDREVLDVLAQLGLDAEEVGRWWARAVKRANEVAGLDAPARDREVVELLREVGVDATTIAKLWRRAKLRAHQHAGIGYPARSSSAGSGGGGGVSNPVLSNVAARELGDARADSRRVELRDDQAAVEIAEAQERLERMRLDARWLINFVYRYTREPAKGQAPPSCRLCAKVGFTSTVYAQERCRWCYDLWRELGDDPDLELVRLHCTRVRVTAAVIRRFHPGYLVETVAEVAQ